MKQICLLLLILLHSYVLNCQVVRDSNLIRIKLDSFDKSHKVDITVQIPTKITLDSNSSEKVPTFTDYLVRYAPIYVPLILIIIHQFIKWRDDKLAIQLKRINAQLSELYGPLKLWHEIGHANFESYTKSGYKVSFTDSNYSKWLKEVFLPTNYEMEKIIIKNADLFVEQIPNVCILFCQHVAALRTCLADLKESDLEYNEQKSLDDRMRRHGHPNYPFRAYIVSSFDILKHEQTLLLSAYNSNIFMKIYRYIFPKSVKEKELYNSINNETKEKAKFFEKTDLLKARLYILPFDSTIIKQVQDSKRIADHKIQYEKTHNYNYAFGELRTKDGIISEEIIEYDKNGKHCNTLFPKKKKWWNKSANLLTLENTFNEDGQINQTYFKNSNKEVFSKAQYHYTNGQKKKVVFYDSAQKLEYKLIYSYDGKGNLVFIEKRDIEDQLFEKVELISVNNNESHYNWYDPSTMEVIGSCTIKMDMFGNVVERIDFDPKTADYNIVKFQYFYDDTDFVSKVIRYDQNDTPQEMRKFTRIKYTSK